MLHVDYLLVDGISGFTTLGKDKRTNVPVTIIEHLKLEAGKQLVWRILREDITLKKGTVTFEKA